MFVFCIESSHARGMGHLYRSLTLADELVESGGLVHFLINDHEPSHKILKYRGYKFETVDLSHNLTGWEANIMKKLNIKVWINDRLNTSADHVNFVKSFGSIVVTFDDRGSGATFSDLNIAAMVFDSNELLRIQGAQVLTGVEHMVLNPSISRYRRYRTKLRSVLITMGGSDTHGVTIKAIEYLREKGLKVTVVTGPSFSHNEELSSIKPYNFKVKRSVPSLIEEMSHHDLAITGGGITPFEANALGLPCLVVANELFEVQVGEALERMGGCYFLGYHKRINYSAFETLPPINLMSLKALATIKVDGTKRVAKAIREFTNS